jgi:hypothetical protein
MFSAGTELPVVTAPTTFTHWLGMSEGVEVVPKGAAGLGRDHGRSPAVEADHATHGSVDRNAHTSQEESRGPWGA